MCIDTTEQKIGCSVSSHDLNLSKKKREERKGEEEKKNYFQHNQSLLWMRRYESGEQKTWHDGAINILLCSRHTPVKSDGEIRQNGRTCKQPWFIAGLQRWRDQSLRLRCLCIYLYCSCMCICCACVCEWVGGQRWGAACCRSRKRGAHTHTRTHTEFVHELTQLSRWGWTQSSSESQAAWHGQQSGGDDRTWTFFVVVFFFLFPFFLFVRACYVLDSWLRGVCEARLVHADRQPAIDQLIDQFDRFSLSELWNVRRRARRAHGEGNRQVMGNYLITVQSLMWLIF